MICGSRQFESRITNHEPRRKRRLFLPLRGNDPVFESPVYLWGLLAASIPWLLPILNRKTPKQVDWAAVRLLEAAIRKTRLQNRTHDFLLIVCRSAIIACVALAFAKPVWNFSPVPLSSENSLRVLLIGDGEPAFYLRHALEASGFSTTVVSSTDADKAVWPNVQVVICADVPSPPNRLKKFHGGTVVFWGGQTDADAWNTRFFDDSVLATSTQPEPGARLTLHDLGQPIVAPFRNEPSAGLLTLPVWRYHPFWMVKSVPILSLDGDPILATDEFHGKRRVFFTTAPDSRCSAMPVWPSFLPLLETSVRWAATPVPQPLKLAHGMIVAAVLLLIAELYLRKKF